MNRMKKKDPSAYNPNRKHCYFSDEVSEHPVNGLVGDFGSHDWLLHDEAEPPAEKCAAELGQPVDPAAPHADESLAVEAESHGGVDLILKFTKELLFTCPPENLAVIVIAA